MCTFIQTASSAVKSNSRKLPLSATNSGGIPICAVSAATLGHPKDSIEVILNTLAFCSSTRAPKVIVVVSAILPCFEDTAVKCLEPRLEFGRQRSEEHTSELQSLMRISYAVFCLKKTIHIRNIS